MPSRNQSEVVPVEAFLEGYAPPMREIAERLREIVLTAVPDALERVRPGWRLIGYDLPVRRHGVFFAWVWPELEHVHLGFPHGVLMNDPAAVLRGDGVTKKARWLTLVPGDLMDEPLLSGLVLEAARMAVVPRGLALVAGWD